MPDSVPKPPDLAHLSNEPLNDPNSDLPIPEEVSWSSIMNSKAPMNASINSSNPVVKPPTKKYKAPDDKSLREPQLVPEKKEKENPQVHMERNIDIIDKAFRKEDDTISYASTADMEGLESRVQIMEQGINSMNDKLEALLSEREVLPKRLGTIHEQLNSVATVLSERITEMQNIQIPIPPKLVANTQTILSSTEQLNLAAKEIKEPPTMSSNIHTTKPLKPKKYIATK